VSYKYDSTKDTTEHINRVEELLNLCADEIKWRGTIHDASKLEEPEKKAFDAETPKLKALTYGSDEYKEALKRLGVALKHHYANNSHHPEHYENGVDGMNLFDVMEMLMDWKAATERHADGDIHKSLIHNKDRFKMSPQLVSIFENTIKMFGW
tara:strand:- start:5190 stop:5648 length:459 start_codon:yes stop_codon:yes gene_type:complete